MIWYIFGESFERRAFSSTLFFSKFFPKRRGETKLRNIFGFSISQGGGDIFDRRRSVFSNITIYQRLAK